MKKDEFLKKLRIKLSNLNPIKVDDIINEYNNYIEDMVEEGYSIEEAIKSFGDFNKLVKELKETYKDYSKDELDVITSFSEKITTSITNILESISHKSFSELVKLFFEILIVIFIIGICHYPVGKLEELGKDVFYILSSPLNQIFYTIWNFILELAYLIISIIAFYKWILIRHIEPIENKKTTKKKKLKNNFGETIIKILVIFFKFVAIIIIFSLSLYLIAMGIILGLCGYLLINKVTYFGLYLVMIALFILGVLFFQLLFRFVLDKEINATKIFISFICSFLLLGFGCSLGALELTNTEFLNLTPEDLQMDSLNEELPFTKDIIFIGNISDYIVDNTLDHVIVEYHYYPIGKRMSVDITKTENKVNLGWNYNEIHISKELITRMIYDLKNKKIYNYYIEPRIIIKANTEQLNIIKKNRQNYYHTLDKYQTCEFTRTYLVENIKKSSEYTYLTLSAYNSEDIYTVKLKKSLTNNVLVDNYYEFTFETYQSYIDTNIIEVFHDATVKQITKTDKIGNKQIQDTTCKVFY